MAGIMATGITVAGATALRMGMGGRRARRLRRAWRLCRAWWWWRAWRRWRRPPLRQGNAAKHQAYRRSHSDGAVEARRPRIRGYRHLRAATRARGVSLARPARA